MSGAASAPLEPGGDYDGVVLEDLDLSGQDGAGARFLDCRLERYRLDGAVLPGGVMGVEAKAVMEERVVAWITALLGQAGALEEQRDPDWRHAYGLAQGAGFILRSRHQKKKG